MRLLLGILLGVGLLLQAIDTILTPQRKIIIKEQFTLLSSRLADYSPKQLALRSLTSFSLTLDRWFGPHPFSFKGICFIVEIHLVLLAPLSCVLLILNRFYERQFDELSFMMMFYSSLVHVYAAFTIDLESLLQIKREIVQNYFLTMKDIATSVHLSLSFVLSTILSYMSLGITRKILHTAVQKKNFKRIVSFLFLDCVIASAMALCFTALITLTSRP